MIEKQDALNRIFKLLPDFQSYYFQKKSSIEDLNGKPMISFEYSLLADFIEEHFTKGKIEVEKFFNFIEDLMLNAVQEVKDAVATCFLENLQSAVIRKTISGEKLFSYLGSESKAYCRAWDEFCGTQTPGFWDEGAPVFNPRKK